MNENQCSGGADEDDGDDDCGGDGVADCGQLSVVVICVARAVLSYQPIQKNCWTPPSQINPHQTNYHSWNNHHKLKYFL